MCPLTLQEGTVKEKANAPEQVSVYPLLAHTCALFTDQSYTLREESVRFNASEILTLSTPLILILNVFDRPEHTYPHGCPQPSADPKFQSTLIFWLHDPS